MANLIKFYIKRILHSPFYLVSVFLIAICFFCFKGLLLLDSIRFINYVAELDCYTYFELLLLIIPFCISTYYLRKPISLEISCLYSHSQIYISRFLSILFSSMLLNILLIIYITVASILEQTSLQFAINALLYFTIRWSILIITAQSVAGFFTYIINSPIVYVICLPTTILFSYLNQALFSLFPITQTHLISSLFSMQKPFVNAMDLDYTGARVDLFLISKSIYVIIGMGLVLTLLWLLMARQKRKPALLLCALTLFQFTAVSLWVVLYPQKYEYQNKLYNTDYPHQVCQIDSYSGEITLDELCSINCEIKIDTFGQESVVLRLDECFAINELKCTAADFSYYRNGDYITISAPKLSNSITISLSYVGRIYYLSDINSVNIFATRNSSALPARFAFLPIIDGDLSKKQYNLEVTAYNTLISNLDVTQLDNTRYSVVGDSVTCSLFSGYFLSFKYNGTIFYRSLYNQITDYTSVWNKSSNYRYFDPFEAELKDPPYSAPRKVFLISAMYGFVGFPMVYDDYTILNYGNVFS